MKIKLLLQKYSVTFAVTALLFATGLILLGSKKAPHLGLKSKDFYVESVATGLQMPWAVTFLPNGDMLVTERTGKLRIVKKGQLDPQDIKGLPAIQYRGQGGLLDVVLHPDYEKNGWIYLSYSSPYAAGEKGAENGSNTALMRAKLDGYQLKDVQVLFKAQPNVRSTPHFGGRIVFDLKGHVFLSLGERGQMEKSQDLSTHQGKIVRLKEDGSVPADNPFVGQANALPEIWSYGHRNPQGLVFDRRTGKLWEHEHGPQGGDELNIVEKAKNYGWPVITYGINYDNSIISDKTHQAGMEQPITYWKPSIAPCGMDFITSDVYGDMKGSLLVGSLKFNNLELLKIENNQVVSKSIVAEKIGRVRDIRQAPDGYLYVVVEDSGQIFKLLPKK
ncbi:MAG: PQQ-dependent sugar dehydrogenase [Pedobacter sp.]|nr:MAG: PQQ-dependent sugar dehydrogenase [Pedobacter sp.]